MNRFFRPPHFSPFWFWTGVFAGSLFWYFLTRLFPTVQKWKADYDARRAARQAARLRRGSGRWRRWLEIYLEKAHLAAPLFPLESVLITPRVMASPPAYVPEGEYRPDDVASLAVPHMPDFPEMDALYRYPTMTLTHALQGGANLLLLGRFGSGKSTALAYLALLATRNDERLGALKEMIPVLVHVADLALPMPDESTPVDVLVGAVGRYMPERLLRGLQRQLPQAMASGKVLLLVDGADEMSPTRQPALAAFLGELLEAYPKVRMVVAASPEHADSLQALGLHPVTMALWSEVEAAAFLRRWGKAWVQDILPMLKQVEGAPKPIDPRMLNRWLLKPVAAYSPLELTLHAWAAYAGDVIGTGIDHAWIAYLRRVLTDTGRKVPALEALALQLVLGPGDSLPASEAGKGSKAWKEADPEPEEEPEAAEEAAKGGKKKRAKPKVRRLLPELLESGVLVAHQGSRVGFVHPLLQAYLAGRGLAEMGGETRLASGDWWEGRTAALGFLAQAGKGAQVAMALIERDDVVTHRSVLAAGRALSYIRNNAPWRPEVLRYLAALLVDVATPFRMRARAAAALALSGERGVGALFRKLLSHTDMTVRWLGALGAGLARDAKAVDDLIGLLSDPSRMVQGASALALVAIGTTEALEEVAAVLLSGDDAQRRMAAEALANHPAEGYPTLREAIGLQDDLRVRRAAVYGLARVSQSWAWEILEQVQVEDSQWVVRDAAAAIVERAKKLSPFAPQALRPLHEEPWLLAFAADHGVGVAPGEPAMMLFHRVLEKGTVEQKEAALGRVPFYPKEDWGRPLYALMYERVGQLRDAAFDAVWLLALAGVQLPSPTQYGFA